MTKTEVYELLEHLEILYPGKYVVDEKSINAIHFHLDDQDKTTVMRNLKRHAKESPFPPSISELVQRKRYPYEAGNPLEKIKIWEAEASGGPKR
jgi:ethanolamine utilization protein EutP (predicted NTPase)